MSSHDLLPHETYLEAAERLLKERLWTAAASWETGEIPNTSNDLKLIRRIYELIRASKGYVEPFEGHPLINCED